ncbi:MAG: dihydrolipoyl dehydrogenase [Candidatus Hydrogenedentes bacterium]|nr:dihydrolipoyl dehydrogenase [Candidatus Hydrogenedentota bacterium]
MDKLKTQVAVVGAGPGGYAAAFKAADLGLDVTLIDAEKNPGGTCLYRGCIPSKALLHVAKLVRDAREAEHWGIKFSEPEIALDRIRQTTEDVVLKLTSGLGQLSKARKINYVQGRASFTGSNTLEVFEEDDIFTVEAEYTILAAGSRPALFGPLIDSPRVMNSSTALQLADLPKNMLVIGAGYIGLELGSVYAALGTQVTVVEMTPSALPGADPDLVKPLQQRLNKDMHEMFFNTKVAEMKPVKNGVQVTLEGEGIEKPTRTFDKVLVCVGRKPNSSGLGLQNTNVEVDDKGFVTVDAQMRTSDPAIFAIGDIVGNPMLAHKASAEGRVAAEVIAGIKAAFEPQAIPAVVFTDPEIAWCGIMESDAKREGRKVTVHRFPWAASGRAMTLNRTDGLTKLICDAETDQVLGMGIVGEGAGELIAEGVLAIEMGALASDLDMTIHPHPTLSETVMESAASVYGMSTHIFRPKKGGKVQTESGEEVETAKTEKTAKG